MSHEKNIVKKPWGYEYLMYENEKVAIWVLYIKEGHRTSMHCHPNKTTGLASLGGKVEVSFLKDSFKLSPTNKIMIRKGLFHSTKSIDKKGSFLLEIETPVDKDDLVRFKDMYGRQGKPYEDSSFEVPKKEECVWIREPTADESDSYLIGETNLLVFGVKNLSFFKGIKEEKNIIFLNGGIMTDYGINVVSPGDIVSSTVLLELVNVFDKLVDGTVVMVMEENV